MADDSYPTVANFDYINGSTGSLEEITVVFTTNVKGENYNDYFNGVFDTDEDVDSIMESFVRPIDFLSIAEIFIGYSIEQLVNYLNKNTSIFDSYEEDVSIDRIIEDWCSPRKFGGYFLNHIAGDNTDKNFFIDRYDSINATIFDDMVRFSIPEQFSKIIYERRRDYLPSRKNNEIRQIFTSMNDNLRNLFVGNKNPMQLGIVDYYYTSENPYTYFTFKGFNTA